MKIPDTITAKVREFYRWHTDNSYTADSEDLAHFLEQALKDVRRETIEEGNEELLRAIEMGRVSGNFDVLLHSVTQLYLAREEANTTP